MQKAKGIPEKPQSDDRMLSVYPLRRLSNQEGDVTMDAFCYSCAAPLTGPSKGPAENYCTCCTNEEGILRPKEEILQGIIQWFQMWQPDMGEAVTQDRAKKYMQAMPAWAE